ncbi:MAG: hypothetical protein K5873_07510 [Treponema sp.]|nr:hypothetical protein [Treponema sp.]
MKTNENESKVNLLKNKKFLLAVMAAITILLLATGLFLFSPSKKYTIAFYKVSDKQRLGISQTIDSIAKKEKFSVNYLEYNSEKSLKDELPLTKKPNLLITTSGYSLETAIDKASSTAPLQIDFPADLTSSLRAAIKTEDNKITALPLLSSHFEVDVDLTEFQNSSTKYINNWNDVEKFLREQKRKKEAPMVFAGGNPETLLDLMGAMAESIDGIDSYKMAVEILKEKTDTKKTAVRLCDDPDSPLATSIKLLKSWYKLGLIHPGAFSFQQNDVEAFASARLSSILFMSLENHRNCANKTISRFTSIYFPSKHGPNSRIFTGKTYYAVPLVKSDKNEKLLTALLSTENQEALSRATGLAPVLAQCRIPDKQSNDARYWIAATSAPLAGLGCEVYMTKQQKTALASEIASRIKN